MHDLAIVFVHLTVTMARLARPGGIRSVVAESVLVRHQLVILNRRWAEVLIIVKPETVDGWHRAGFRLYWRWRSRPGGGRPKVAEEVRILIRRLADEECRVGRAQNPWGTANSRLVGKDTPESRPIERKPKADATVISLPRLGGLHHRYAWREAA